mgnify:FL=1
MRTIDGLQTILLGEPQSVHNFPALYGAYIEIDPVLRNTPPAKNQIGFTHKFILRLVIQWVHNEQAEMQLLSLVDAIPLAIDADPKLGGRLRGGMATITIGSGGFAPIGDVVHRVVDYTCQVLEKYEAST